MKLARLAFGVYLAAAFASPAFGCMSPATYRSVVVNVAPSEIPQGAILLQVQVETGLFSPSNDVLLGLRGRILSGRVVETEATQFEIVTLLGSMCNTWVEMWSSDHNATDGVLTGYIAGYPRGLREGYLIIEPLLYQAAAYRDSSSSGARLRVSEGGARRLDPNATWRPFRIDAAALAGNLETTNAQIRADLEQRSQQ